MKDRFEAFTVLITKINRCIHKLKTEETVEYKLKSPHVSCLYYLYKAKTLTAKELADVCAEDKASISRSIDYLEENGFITCNSQVKKRYRAELFLTEKGEKTSKALAEKIDGILDLAGAGISEEDRGIMYRCLTIINDNLQQICKKYD